MKVKCPWCGLFNREIPDEDFVENSSYICLSCADKLLADTIGPVDESTSQRNPSAPGRYAGGKEGE